MTVLRTSTCGNCKFAESNAAAPFKLECRLNPPATTMHLVGMNEQGQTQFHPIMTFAFVMPDLWCGQHRPKILAG